MDQVLNKVGTYWFSKRANKEISSVGDDINDLQTQQTIGSGREVDDLYHLEPGGTAAFHSSTDSQINQPPRDAYLWHSRLGHLPYRALKVLFPQLFSYLSTESLQCESMSNSIEGGAKWLVNKIKGKMQKPLPELLREYDMPAGIFPRDATHYEFNEETGKLTVYVPSICEVGYKDSSVLRFLTIVTAYLEKGKLADIEGMKTKVLIWQKVTSITTEGSKVHFATGVKKTRARDAYEVLRDGISIDKF